MDFFKKTGGALRGLFREAVRSCYDMEFYRVVRERPWAGALRYAAAMQACLLLVAALFLAPVITEFRTRLAAHLRAQVPTDARFSIEHGRLATTLSPQTDIGVKDFPVIIDTTVEGVGAADRTPAAGILAGRDAIYLAEGGGTAKTYPLADLPDLNFSREDVLGRLDRLSGGFLAAAFVFFAAFWYLGSMVGISVYVLPASLAATFAGRLFGVRLRYGQWVAVGFHAVTLPLVVTAGFGASGIPIPYAFSFIFFMFVAAVTLDERARPTSPPEPPLKHPRRRLARSKTVKGGSASGGKPVESGPAASGHR